MAEGGYGDRFFADINTRIRDLEEKQRLLGDRMKLISESFIKGRDNNFSEVNELVREVEKLKSDNERLKAIVIGLGEMINKSARREELSILQRQFELFRK